MNPTVDKVEPLRVCLRRCTRIALRDIVLQAPDLFEVVLSPEEAELIIYGYDGGPHVRQSQEFQRWPWKCVVVTERDDPSYFLPGCYAANRKCFLSRRRAKTIPYMMAARELPNPFVKSFALDGPRRYLYSFVGGATSWVRKKLFRNPPCHPDVYIEETNQYWHFNCKQAYLDQKLPQQERYAAILEQSSFVVCPRGGGVSSIRIFEVMQAGRVPVILADPWIPVEGIPWNTFALFVPESKLACLDKIIRAKSASASEMGARAQIAWREFCAPGKEAVLLSRALRDIQRTRSEKKEMCLRSLFLILEWGQRARAKARLTTKYLILSAFARAGRKFPYSLKRPMDEEIRKLKNRL